MVYAFNYFHSSCSHHLIEMHHGPFNEREDRRHEGFTRFGKGVFHAWWNFGIHLSMHQMALLKVFQGL